MNLLEKTKQLCQLYSIKPARSRGQNFLISESIYNQIIKVADLKKEDIVLEVGPGLGFLTERLARKVKKVIAVELDDKLVKVLQNRLREQEIENVEVINDDIMKLEIRNWKLENVNSANFKFQISNFKIVANLPYNITSIFLRKFLSLEYKPESMVLMLQKEVAERIVAQPLLRRRSGQAPMSLLAVSIQFYAHPEMIQIVPASSFWPKPEVDSAIIKLKIKNEKLKINEKEFFRLVRIGFSAKRKMLKNNLANGYHIDQEKVKKWLETANFSLKIRAQELAVKDWIKLFGFFKKNML